MIILSSDGHRRLWFQLAGGLGDGETPAGMYNDGLVNWRQRLKCSIPERTSLKVLIS